MKSFLSPGKESAVHHADEGAAAHIDDRRAGTAVQRRLAEVAQRKGAEEEEPLQRAGVEEEEPMQRAGVEEEEMPAQRAGVEEEEKPVQRAGVEEEDPMQRASVEEEEPAQRIPVSNGGLPGGLKAGIEGLSGIGMDDVRVHYNSSEPAQMRAHAFTQGSDIHVAPGQEKYLPHEAWHVVQQKQGRVQPTIQMKSVPVNDDAGLEQEADVMGAKAAAAQRKRDPNAALDTKPTTSKILQGDFFEKTENGNYIWHDEPPDNSYTQLNETRAYHSWYNPLRAIYGSYDVYTRGAVDRSGKLIEGGLSPQERQALLNVYAQIQGTPYEDIIDYLERRILVNLGAPTLEEFYRGAHIVFDDGGRVYRDVFGLGVTVGKFRKQTWKEWITGTDVQQTPHNLTPSHKGGPGMGSRRPEKRETSHYGQDALPQLGIDLPGQLSGHILVGMVPNDPFRYGSSAGNSFVQTEMFGFKTWYDAYIGHAKGFFWNFVKSDQSGMIGFCKYSEKSQSEIREQDNPHI